MDHPGILRGSKETIPGRVPHSLHSIGRSTIRFLIPSTLEFLMFSLPGRCPAQKPWQGLFLGLELCPQILREQLLTLRGSASSPPTEQRAFTGSLLARGNSCFLRKVLSQVFLQPGCSFLSVQSRFPLELWDEQFPGLSSALSVYCESGMVLVQCKICPQGLLCFLKS